MKLDSLGRVEPECRIEYDITDIEEPSDTGQGWEELFELKHNLLSEGQPLIVNILVIRDEARMRLFDTSGRTLVEQEVRAFEHVVLAVHLTPGIYWISVETANYRRQVCEFGVGF